MYSQFRCELESKLRLFDNVADILSVVDSVANKYNIEKIETLPALVTGIPEEVNIFLGCKAVEGLSVNTLNAYKLYLDKFFSITQKRLNEITANDIRLYLFSYQQSNNISSVSVDKIRQNLNNFFAWCVDEGYCDSNPAKSIKKIKCEQKHREALTRLELEYVRNACKTIRDKAVIEFLYSTGCRVSELCGVKKNDVDWMNRTVTVFGKGKKYRQVYINDKCYFVLQQYLNSRTDDNEYLFITDRGAKQLNKDAVERMFSRNFSSISERIGKPITPHIIRHTTATNMLEGGSKVEVVKELLGHSNIATTMIYCDVNNSTVQNEHKRYVV